MTRTHRFSQTWLMATRTRQGHLQTGVYTMRRDDRTITLVGVCHIGRRRYYNQIYRILADHSQRGAEVHYESLIVERRATEPVEKLLAETAETGAELNAAERLGGYLGLVGQRHVLTERLRQLPGARNIDASTVDAFRGLSSYGLVALQDSSIVDEIPERYRPWIARAVLFALRRFGRPLAFLSPALTPRHHLAVIVDRNALATHHALDTARARDVVLVWGANHLPGMVRRFQRAGFTLTEAQYLEAF